MTDATDATDATVPDAAPKRRDAGGMNATDPVPELVDFTCPRCRVLASEAYYGPCRSCRGDLRATLGGDAREVTATDYEPKMNVTPNAVATKD